MFLLLSSIKDALEGFFLGFVNVIPKLLYWITMSVASLLDVAQALFRRIVGLDSYYVLGNETGGSDKVLSKDIVTEFIEGIISGEGGYSGLQTIFFGMLILGVLLLIISSVAMSIKVEFNTTSKDERGEFKSGNSRGGILKNFFRGFFILAIVPAATIFSMYALNAIMFALDKITTPSMESSSLANIQYVDSNGVAQSAFKMNSQGSYSYYEIFGLESIDLLNIDSIGSKSTTFSGIIFKCITQDANRARNDEEFYNQVLFATSSSKSVTSNFGIFNQSTDKYEVADMIDVAFANNAQLDEGYEYYNAKLDKSSGYMVRNCSGHLFNADNGIKGFSKLNVSVMWYYYNLWMVNYIVAFAFIYFAAKMLFTIIFGLIKRMITLIMLFIAYPVVVGIYPINSKMFDSKWMDTFKKNIITAIATVAGMNLLFCILPYFDLITFFPPTWTAVNNIINAAFMLVALAVVNDIIKLASEITGGGNALDDGAKVQGEAVKAAKGVGKIGKPLLSPAVGAAMLMGAGAGKALGLAARGVGRAAKAGVRNIGTSRALGSANKTENKQLKELDDSAANATKENNDIEQLKIDQLQQADAEWAQNNKAKGDVLQKHQFQEALRSRYDASNPGETTFNQWKKSKEGQATIKEFDYNNKNNKKAAQEAIYKERLKHSYTEEEKKKFEDNKKIIEESEAKKAEIKQNAEAQRQAIKDAKKNAIAADKEKRKTKAEQKKAYNEAHGGSLTARGLKNLFSKEWAKEMKNVGSIALTGKDIEEPKKKDGK